jgi:hypothetical protein
MPQHKIGCEIVEQPGGKDEHDKSGTVMGEALRHHGRRSGASNMGPNRRPPRRHSGQPLLHLIQAFTDHKGAA